MFGPFGVILWVIFWILVIGIFIRLVFGSGWHDMHHQDDEIRRKDALDILRERYAKGEIDKREFEEKKADLNS